MSFQANNAQKKFSFVQIFQGKNFEKKSQSIFSTSLVTDLVVKVLLKGVS
jgi:hypothetical protein